MRRIFLPAGCLFSTLILFAAPAQADWRSFVWTYEYKIQERGTAEFEDYFTLASPEMDRMKGITTVEHQFELEIGMDDRYDFAIYQVFRQAPGESFEYEGFKLRNRFILAEKGAFVFDPLLYVEYIGKPDFSEHEIEFKLIAERDIGDLILAVNPILSLEKGDEWESDPGYAAGLSYEVTPLLRAGIEFKGSEAGHFIGPVISHGQPNLWAALGAAFGYADIESGRPEVQIRLLLGVGLVD